MSFMVTLDTEAYKTKPDTSEAGRITARMKSAHPTELDEASFCEHVRQGKTWVGATYQPRGSGWGLFVGQQVFALDIDNATEYARKDGGRGKRPLLADEEGHLSPTEALARCEALGLVPLCTYATMHDRPENRRFRLVFVMPEPVADEGEARGIIAALLRAFPEADPSCKNPNRLFYGSNGTVTELWRGEAPA